MEYRLGYAARPSADPAQVTVLSKLDSAAAATDTVADLPVSFTWQQTGERIAMVAHVDIGKLHFKSSAGRRVQKLAWLRWFATARAISLAVCAVRCN